MDKISDHLKNQDHKALMLIKRKELIAYYQQHYPNTGVSIGKLRLEWLVRELLAAVRPYSKNLSRRLDQLAECYLKSEQSRLKTHIAFKGENLIERRWHGKVYQVSIRGKDFYYEGQAYSSLSAIAKIITGVKWSGPVFFGLSKIERKQA